MRGTQELEAPETDRARRNATCVIAVFWLVVAAFGTGAASAATARATHLVLLPAPTFLRGAFVGSANSGGIAAFDATTGTNTVIASDYLPSNEGWSGMDGSGNSLSWLLAHGWSSKGYTLSLGVPIIPSGSSGNPVGDLAQGATGAYNAYFVTLARTLIAGGEGNAYLRLGWEFDGAWETWNATNPSEEADFAGYFAQIVTAMRSVAGEAFRFVWNPDADAFTTLGYNVALAYPGNSYVDVIGLDAYDQTWILPHTPANEWTETTLPAITAAQQFAAARGKPLAFPEWGVAIRADGHGLGDDPLFVNDFTAWMRNPGNNVAYESYFDYNGDGTNSIITGGSFPQSLAAFSSGLNPIRSVTMNGSDG